jgi:hypothetical protein
MHFLLNTQSRYLYIVYSIFCHSNFFVANVCIFYLNDVVGWHENMIYSRISIQYVYVNDHSLEKLSSIGNDSGHGSICSHHQKNIFKM